MALVKVAHTSDVIVVGGGPAGLATAIAARELGLSVTVLERRQPPIDKACGEGLMPDGVGRLAALGVRLEPVSVRPFRGIRYLDADLVAEGFFPREPGLGIRRTELHRAMVDRAAQSGAGLLWGVTAKGLTGEGVETDEGLFAARWIVGADGLSSRVRRWAGLGEKRGRARRFGVRRHFAITPWTDLVEVYWASGCEAYVTPVSRREVGVALLWSGEKAGFDRHLERFPQLRARLAGATPTTRDRGAGPLAQRARVVCRGRVALVGDAAGYLDAITGEGLSLAFHQATALAAAIRREDLGAYARQWRRLSAMPFAFIRALLVAERRPWLRRRLMRTLADEPELFARFLAIHARERPLRSLGAANTGRLLWGLLR
jgi:flavin-dependent dehydrogenase